jgi:tetratricopeptide (TPR) repeat protein
VKWERRRGGVEPEREAVEAAALDAAAEALWHRLDGLPYAQQIELIESDPRFHRRELCRRLHQLSMVATMVAPRVGTQLANLALRTGRHLGGGSSARLLDLEALGLACLGNARRALGELHGAADALNMARTLRAAGTGDPEVEAEILSIEAVLRCAEHRLGDALSLLDRMEACLAGGAPAVPDPVAPAGGMAALVLRAWCFYHLGEHEAALSLLLEAERRDDASAAWSQDLAIRSGLVWSAVTRRRWPEARIRLAAAVASAEREGDEALRQQLRLAEARIDRASGERTAAEGALRQAAAELVRLEVGADAVLAWLELASLYVEEGDAVALRRLALAEILPAFVLAEVGGEEVARLMEFQGVCCRGELTVAAVAELASAIERTRRTPLAWWSAWGTVLGDEARRDAAPVAG